MKTLTIILLLTSGLSAQTLFDSGRIRNIDWKWRGREGALGVSGGRYYCEQLGWDPRRCISHFGIGFTLRDPAEINGIDFLLQTLDEEVSWTDEQGEVRVRLFPSGPDGLPAAEILQETSFRMPPGLSHDWRGPRDISWQLGAGSYWISLDAEHSRFTGGIYWDDEAVELPTAGFHIDFGNWTPSWHPTTNEGGVGIVIYGETEGRGDLDLDGDLTVEDLDLLGYAIQSGLLSRQDRLYDIDRDEIVWRADWIALRDQIRIAGLNPLLPGDVTIDSTFTTSDLIELFIRGEYEDEIPWNSTWRDGDFNGDFDFDSADLVGALSIGHYEQDSQFAIAVPEPSAALLLVVGLLVLTGIGRRFVVFVLRTAIWIPMLFVRIALGLVVGVLALVGFIVTFKLVTD